MLLIIFPNQLYAKHPGLKLKPEKVILLEHSLFFGDKRYPAKFHQQKLWLHRASMKRYEQRLRKQGHTVDYIEYAGDVCLLEKAFSAASLGKGVKDKRLVVSDPTDFVLEKRLRRTAESAGLELELLPNPSFVNSRQDNADYRSGKKRWFMADFYKWQRQRLGILLEDDEPVGGKWSFDEDNRKKVPKAKLDSIPELMSLTRDDVDEEAKRYVENRFAGNPGTLESLYYPTSHSTASRWLKHFLSARFEHFGDFEDAIVQGESWLWHSVLTPALNIGLLTPQEVVSAALKHSEKHEVPLNSLEGFLRQIIGWREFMRATYEDLGSQMRTTNYWSHDRPMPDSFYDGTTGITPVDDTIQRVIETGYCHHIERLMVLGGFMFLCEIDPDAIYRWFMEMFVDSYDWVMVPNVYAMSQNADGGLITTKPYFSGSSYVRKMSHYKKADWCHAWDGLYWRWIWNHRDELKQNPRWAMMCSMVQKMESAKRKQHLEHAENFLKRLNT